MVAELNNHSTCSCWSVIVAEKDLFARMCCKGQNDIFFCSFKHTLNNISNQYRQQGIKDIFFPSFLQWRSLFLTIAPSLFLGSSRYPVPAHTHLYNDIRLPIRGCSVHAVNVCVQGFLHTQASLVGGVIAGYYDIRKGSWKKLSIDTLFHILVVASFSGFFLLLLLLFSCYYCWWWWWLKGLEKDLEMHFEWTSANEYM